MLFGHGISVLNEKMEESQFVGVESESEDGAAADRGKE